MKINELLEITTKENASDLHISSGQAPIIRVDGELKRLNLPPLSNTEVYKMICSLLNSTQEAKFKKNLEIDFALTVANIGRFRVNAYHRFGGCAIAFRPISEKIFTLEELQLPAVLKKLCSLPNGLVLLTGPTGSGKSTTLAALIDMINETKASHIITIEDPIEYIHTSKKSLINQREIGQDTHSFSNALRAALREDPDVILVGEMRDLKTIRLALTAAETGHLVFATLHTSSAAKTINRIIDVFPAGEKELVRIMLSESLRAVISQTLLKKEGGGRIPAMEIMICTPAIKNLIRENKSAQIYSTIQTGAQHGMQTLDQYLHQLVTKKIISHETANEVAIFQIGRE